MFVFYVVFALILTCAIEALVLFVLFRNKKGWIKYSLCCNVITNPLVNVALAVIVRFMARFIDINLALLILILEILAIISEAYIYKFLAREKFSTCLIVSIVANVLSFILGLLVAVG